MIIIRNIFFSYKSKDPSEEIPFFPESKFPFRHMSNVYGTKSIIEFLRTKSVVN